MPSTTADFKSSLRRLRTTPARKPCTECDCQPVAFVSAAMVAPPGERSMSIAADCFVPRWAAATRLSFCPALLCFGRLLDGAADLAVVLFFAVFVIGISFGSVAACRLHCRSPAVALKPAGRDSGATKARRKQASSAPITSKCQSFLDNNVADYPQSSRDDPMGVRISSH